MNFVKKFLSVLGLTVALSTNAVAALVRVTDSNGILTGANGVDVGGILYDVTFGDGIYADSISAFNTRASAQLAAEALDTVFQEIYDTSPQLTFGCFNTSVCAIDTPYSSNSSRTFSYAMVNYSVGRDDFTNPSHLDLTSSSADTPARTVALWKLSNTISAVPEPETYAMFLAGLGLLGFVSRRRKQKAAV